MTQQKVISSNKVARQLVKNGFPIVDIKAHKSDPKRTVFVFDLTQSLVDYLAANKLEV